MIYPASAVLVIYDPRDHTQRFFDKHDDDVSGMAIHPDGEIVASGQVGHAPVSCFVVCRWYNCLFFFYFFFIFFLFFLFCLFVVGKVQYIAITQACLCVHSDTQSQHICVLTLFFTCLFTLSSSSPSPLSLSLFISLSLLISRSLSFGEQYHTTTKIQILIYLIHVENLKVNSWVN